jgi:hypothetical protein
MAQLSKPAIPPKMYKHFAVATCALTALLALFASGAPQDDTAGRPTAQPTRSATPSPRTSPTPAYGQAQFDTGGKIEAGNGYQVYQEYDSAYQRTVSGRGTIGEIGASSQPRAGSENAGFTREYLDSLTDEELEELLRQLRAGGVADPATRAQIMQVLETGSRRRSGVS